MVMTHKKRDDQEIKKEVDQGTVSREYVRKKWVDKDPEVVPEECRTGRCGHKEHQIKHEKPD